jgi:energy-coupling factor transporter ATP-binding protein EcfA2
MGEVIGRLIDVMHGRLVPLEGVKSVMVHFRDREGEVERFYADVRRLRGVVTLYGPRGAGKSTLMRLMCEGIREVGGFEDTLFVRYSFAEVMIEEAHVSIPGVNEGSVREVINALEDAANGVSLNLSPFGLAGALVKPIILLSRAIRSRAELRGRDNVVVVYDDVDKFLRRYGGYDVLEAIANATADVITEHDAPVNAVFTVSDQAAVAAAGRLGSKGRVYLLWNLPRSAFEDVVNEAAGIMNVGNVDTELLWNLMGGNMRELGILAGNYNWDVKAWLQGVIMRVTAALEGYGRVREIKSISEVLARLIRKGKSAADAYGLGEFVGQPDAVEGYFNLLEENIMIYLGMPGCRYLSELPREPWVGGRFAYQIPAYYWALRAMIERGSVNVDSDDVIKVINKSRNSS